MFSSVPPIRSFWPGVMLGVAFRVFAYAWVGWLNGHADPWSRAVPAFLSSSLTVLLGITVLSAPFAVPVVAGFLSAYFCRQLEAPLYVKAIWLSAVVPWLCLIFVPDAYFLAAGILLLLPLDVGLCGIGVDRGVLFWNSRQSRQLLGDFLTHDEDEEARP